MSANVRMAQCSKTRLSGFNETYGLAVFHMKRRCHKELFSHYSKRNRENDSQLNRSSQMDGYEQRLCVTCEYQGPMSKKIVSRPRDIFLVILLLLLGGIPGMIFILLSYRYTCPKCKGRATIRLDDNYSKR